MGETLKWSYIPMDWAGNGFLHFLTLDCIGACKTTLGL